MTPAPTPSDDTGDLGIAQVACLSTSACLVRGDDDTAAAGDGASYIDILNPMSPATATVDRPDAEDIRGIACSTLLCWVVGDVFIVGQQNSYDHPYVASYAAGSSLTPQSGAFVPGDLTAMPAYQAVLDEVACDPTGTCTAIGEGAPEPAGGAAPELYSVDLGSDTTQTITLPSGLTGAGVTWDALSCPAAGVCVATADYTLGSGAAATSGTLGAALQNGAWTVKVLPVPADAKQMEFLGLACGSATNCEAVGFATLGQGGNEGIAESWDGTNWTPVEVPGTAGQQNVLNAVACPSGTACVAAADLSGGLAAVTLTGASASVSALTPTTGYRPDTLTFDRVACSPAGTCTIYGDGYRADPTTSALEGINEFWTQSSGAWTLSDVVTASSQPYSDPASIACPSSTECVADGLYDDSSGGGHPYFAVSAPAS